MTRKEAVTVFFERVKKAYIEEQRAQNMRASGRSAASLMIQASDNAGQMTGADYFYFQKYGRKPGGFPPIESIMDWLRTKTTFRIDDERGPGLRGLAFAIAKKIAKQGTDIASGKRPGLSIEDRIEEFKKQLVQDIAQVEKEKIIEAIKNRRN